MKRKLILCLALSAVLLFTCTAQAAAVMPPVDVSKSNSEFNIQLSQTAAQTSSEIPKEQFGGSYIKDGVIYINIVQEYYPDYSQASSRKNGCKITYQPVKFSLEYLEDIMYRMIPYMAQYQICTIDADDVNNTINLEVIEDTNELRQFVQDFIDLKHVKITVTSSYPQFTVAYMSPEDKIDDAINISSNESRSNNVIYPGAKICNSAGEYFTAGPKYSYNRFITCGHSFVSNGLVYSTTIPQVRYGFVDSYTFGRSGDYAKILIDSANVSLPSENKFLFGNATYSLLPVSNVNIGDHIELWGAFSGVSTGYILEKNKTVSVGGTTTVSGLVRTNATCKRGDSGGGFFTYNSINLSQSYCYGTQSCADSLIGDTYQYSYFQPFNYN